MPLIIAFRRQRQTDLPESKANLVYIRSFNPAKLYNTACLDIYTLRLRV